MCGLRLCSGRPPSGSRFLPLLRRTAFFLVLAVETLPAQGTGVVMAEPFDTIVPPNLPAGWVSSRNRSALQNDFVSSASGARSLPNALLSTNATVSQELTSPAISFRDRTPGTLSFSLRRSSTHTANLLVEASTDGGAGFGVRIGDTLRASGETIYQTAVLSLPELLQGISEVYFRWRTIAAWTGSSGTLRIDDVVLTAPAVHDIAVAGFRYDQAAARESSMISASVMIAGTGRERTGDVAVVLGVDDDTDGVLAGGEIWSCATLSPSPAAGETVAVAAEFLVPTAGEYRLVVTADAAGDQESGNDTLLVPFLAGYRRHAAVVNEILYAPAGGEAEWIEILNTGRSEIPLASWRIGDAASPTGKTISTTPVSLPADGMVVVARSPSLGTARPGCSTSAIAMEGFPSLNNGGDAVILRDMSGCVIDSVPYLPEWGGASGRSLERRDGLGPSDDKANWGSSVDSTGATPGCRNSIAVLDTDLALAACGCSRTTAGENMELYVTVRNVGRTAVAGGDVEAFDLREEDRQMRIARATIPSPLGRGDSMGMTLLWEAPPGGLHHLLFRLDAPGDCRRANDTLGLWVLAGYRNPSVRINEIMAVPRQGEAEYVEILNAGSEIIDLAGWTIGGREEGAVSPKRFRLSGRTVRFPPGGTFVLCSDSSLFRRFVLCDSLHVTVAGTGSLQLNNDADVVVLRDGSGATVDSLAYSAQWQSPAYPDPVGRSLERISPLLASSDGRNWGTCVAAAGGTPGCPNSIRAEESAAVSRVMAVPNPFSPDGDGHDDRTMIHFENPRPSGWMSIRIYDIRGRLIRFLANNEPCGGRGSVVWDGFDDDRRRVRIGVYIILLEIAGEDRETAVTARGSVVVAGKLR